MSPTVDKAGFQTRAGLLKSKYWISKDASKAKALLKKIENL
jgi:hypothetical protein